MNISPISESIHCIMRHGCDKLPENVIYTGQEDTAVAGVAGAAVRLC